MKAGKSQSAIANAELESARNKYYTALLSANSLIQDRGEAGERRDG